MNTYWNRFVQWSGWKKIFPFPVWADILMFCVFGFGLIWVFVNGLENWWPSYVLYVLSAYSLTALCIKLPSAVQKEKAWLKNHTKVERLLNNKELHFNLELYFEQFVNFSYGIFKIVSGVMVGSAWFGADGIYNFVQALIQLFQILRRRNPGDIKKQWKSYRLCGFLILLMHLTLIGIVFQRVNWNRVDESGEIMIIATAAFAFYKFISSFIDLAKDRKHTRPIDSSVRMLELSQAIFAIFSLQAGLLHTFGTGESWEHWLNLATGCVVCLLTVAMGIYMIRRAKREIKKLQEINNE